MMRRIFNGSYAMNAIFESKRNLLAAALATGILYFTNQYIIMRILEPLGGDAVLRFQLSFDVKSVAALLAAWGPAGIETFKTHFYLDFIHPFLYGAFLFFSILYLKTELSGAASTAGIPLYCYIPCAGAALDLAENLMELAVLGQNPDLSAALVFATALVSLVKWVLAGISILIIVVMGVRLVARLLPRAS
jgi:hypothetical protein